MKYEESEAQKKTRENNFVYHSPQKDQIERYATIREDANKFSLYLNQNCPPSRELSLTQTKLEEVVMWANAAIARNEKDSNGP